MVEARSSADALRDVLAQIDAGQVKATNVERAYIAGALAALESLVIEAESTGDDPS